jgi:hypothetical protein
MYDIQGDTLVHIFVSKTAIVDIAVLAVRDSTVYELDDGLAFVAIPAPLTDNIFNVYHVTDTGATVVYNDVNHYAGAGAGGDYYFYVDDTTDGTVKKYDGTTVSDYKVFTGEDVTRLESRDEVLYISYSNSEGDDDSDYHLLVDDLTTETTVTAGANSYPLVKNDTTTLIFDSSWDHTIHQVDTTTLSEVLVDQANIMQAEPIGNSNVFFAASTTRHGNQSIYKLTGNTVELELNQISTDGVNFNSVNDPIESVAVVNGITYMIVYDNDDNYFAYKIENEQLTQIRHLSYDIEYDIINDNGTPAIYREEDDGSIGLYTLDLSFIRFLEKPLVE